MKVVVFGATGMVGQGVLRESLMAPDVEQVLAITRTPVGLTHPRLREIIHTDFTDLSPLRDRLAGMDACFYCLGVSSVGMDEGRYTTISYDFPMAAARTFAEVNPQVCFIYVSGAGTRADSRQMWSRVKARAERDINDLLPNGYAARPGIIQPTHGVRSKVRWYNAVATVVAAVVPLLERIAPRYITTTDRLGRAMLRVARAGFPRRILENADLR